MLAAAAGVGVHHGAQGGERLRAASPCASICVGNLLESWNVFGSFWGFFRDAPPALVRDVHPRSRRAAAGTRLRSKTRPPVAEGVRPADAARRGATARHLETRTSR